MQTWFGDQSVADIGPDFQKTCYPPRVNFPAVSQSSLPLTGYRGTPDSWAISNLSLHFTQEGIPSGHTTQVEGPIIAPPVSPEDHEVSG